MADATRRALLLGGAAAAGLAGGAAWTLRPRPALGEGAVSVAAAHRMAAAGDVLLVDIRRPDEWAATGVAAGAATLDMRDDAFVARLAALAGGDRSRPVALICAAGVRSRRMAGRLRDAGFTGVIDVPEGMLGSAAGPGWLARGLPVQAPR